LKSTNATTKNTVSGKSSSNDSSNANAANNEEDSSQSSSSSRPQPLSSSSSKQLPASGAPYQRAEMMQHTILTKQEEFTYGRQVVRARELREAIEELLEERRLMRERMEEEELLLRSMNSEGGDINDDDGIMGEYFEGEEVHSIINGHDEIAQDNNEEEGQQQQQLNQDFLSYELEYLSLYGFRPTIQDFENDRLDNGQRSTNNDPINSGVGGENTLGGLDLEDDLLIDHAQHRSHHMSQLRNNPSSSSTTTTTKKRSGYRNSSTSSTAGSNSYTPLLHIPIHELSESDIIHTLQIPGGKAELVNLLLDGAYAREVLMRRNVKLVTSIAKNWMRNSFSTANANLGSSSSTPSSSNGKSTRKFLSQMYEGSWDRPSLDEAVQEGMLGLARAVDKYDPERGLRFSTYATHWITSYVRVCFQRAVTGCLRVPSQLHDIKSAYQKIVKDHLVSGEEPPEQGDIAKTLGITPQRLSTAIRATGSLVSVDAPVISPGSGSYKGSAAGGDGANSQELLILDTLKCAEPKPEDQVEISFLRQCLENAMASELNVFERDVLRLRLGLDSGTGKTVREIVEICGGGVTMSDVRSAERRAFKKLRSPTSVHTHNLLAYLDLAGADTLR
jgi:RNA polymerase sigma factor (sigma-70 family)